MHYSALLCRRPILSLSLGSASCSFVRSEYETTLSRQRHVDLLSALPHGALVPPTGVLFFFGTNNVDRFEKKRREGLSWQPQWPPSLLLPSRDPSFLPTPLHPTHRCVRLTSFSCLFLGSFRALVCSRSSGNRVQSHLQIYKRRRRRRRRPPPTGLHHRISIICERLSVARRRASQRNFDIIKKLREQNSNTEEN